MRHHSAEHYQFVGRIHNPTFHGNFRLDDDGRLAAARDKGANPVGLQSDLRLATDAHGFNDRKKAQKREGENDPRQECRSHKEATRRQLREFARLHFGPYAGWAQQYLFFAERTRNRNMRKS